MNLEIRSKKAISVQSTHPLIFIHGAAGGAWYFDNFLEYFSKKGYDSYAISLRGHGLSEGREHIDSYGLDDYVEDVKSLVKKLESKPILIGHSMGGAVVQKYMNNNQEDLTAAILLSSAEAGGIDKESPLGLFFSDAVKFLRKIRKDYPEKRITIDQLLNETVFSNRFSEIELNEIKRKLTKESAQVKKELLNPFIDDYKKIKIPVCVIGSKNDHIVTIDKTIKTANAFQVIPIFIDTVCHFLTIDPDWEDAAIALLSFISKLE
jgi:alpha-beta hydrolase superfamily lysophospholipase